MSRLSIITPSQAQTTVEMLYKDLERRIIASPPGLCPVDMAASFLKLCHAQTCGKCTPCRIGLAQLGNLLDDVLSGNADMDTLQLIEDTAQTIYDTADCAIGYEAAEMVLKGVKGFRDDYIEHIQHNRCTATLNQPVPCVSQCPAHVDIPGYVALVGQKRYDDAVRLIRQDNPFVTTCAFICEHPCENRCRRNMLDDSVNIRGIKRFAADHISNDYVPKLADPTGKKVAVIGGGPGGLSAAYYLAIMGHDVTVYEQREKLGGMLRYGIPAYRLPRERLDDEIKHILSTGIKVKTNVSIGKDMPISQIQKKFDAIYIAIGAHIDKKIGIEGEDSKNVISAVEMLRAIGDDNYPDFKGKNIVVIGGGNVAMDVVRSSVRLGAKKVTCVYRRRQEDMTALAEEVEGAIAEGVVMETLKAPARIEADKDGKAVALWVKPQIISKVKNGRPSPADSKLDEERIPADLIIRQERQLRSHGSGRRRRVRRPVRRRRLRHRPCHRHPRHRGGQSRGGQHRRISGLQTHDLPRRGDPAAQHGRQGSLRPRRDARARPAGQKVRFPVHRGRHDRRRDAAGDEQMPALRPLRIRRL